MEAASSSRSSVPVGHKRKRSQESTSTTNDAVSQSTSIPSSSSSSISGQLGYEYDVFLSFRGEDTRKGFADTLYNRLKGAGICVFRDNEELHVGEEIGPELFHAIEHSNISLPIFSKDYASSKWCLKEFAFMMGCREARKQTVLPVFYDVTPNEVQHQTGNYAASFEKHAKEQDTETVKKWRKALAEAGSLKGWELKNDTDGYQGKLIEKVVTEVSKILKMADLCVGNNLVGIDRHVVTVMEMLDVEASDVRFIGIWGMGGIGKTTLAKFIYNQILNGFDSCSFLQDVRETSGRSGLTQLQSQLIADLLRCPRQEIATEDRGINELKRRFHEKKVLILLDDVDHVDQLNKLAAEAGWFGRGSRIITTTRNRDVLKAARKQHIYEVPELDAAQALQLFCKHALGRDTPTDKDRALSEKIVKTTGGLPLTLEVVGSFLHGKSEDVWTATSKRLTKVPNKDVQDKLRISYDSLDRHQKQLFLDITCLFIGDDKSIVTYILGVLYDCPLEADIEVLKQLSLIKIEDDNRLWMHDQLRDLGREIDRQENPTGQGKSRRLRGMEALDVLENYQGSKCVEALRLDYYGGVHLTPEHFRELSNLRFLQLNYAKLVGNFDHLLPELRYLRWNVNPLCSAAINMYLKNLIILDLSRSKVMHDWNLWNSIQKTTRRLRFLDLSNCWELTRTPDLSTFPYLERLNLENCFSLEEIHPSIGKLKSLAILNMSGCRSIKELPELVGCKDTLLELHVDGTSLKVLKLGGLKELKRMSARNCPELERLLSLSSLRRLTYLVADNCEKLQGLDGLDKLESLCRLQIGKCKLIQKLPNMSNLKSLEFLHADGCERLEGLEGLEGLEVLTELRISGCKSIDRLPDLSNLKLLRHLLAHNCEKLLGLEGLDKLEALGELHIGGCKLIERLPDLSNLKSLEHLYAQSFKKLRGLEGLDKLEELVELVIDGCESIERLPDLSKLKSVGRLYAKNCEKLRGLEGLDKLEELVELVIDGCESIERLPDLSKLKSLGRLYAKNCEKLQGLEGLDKLGRLRELVVDGCKSIERLPDLSNLKLLMRLNAKNCEKLQGLEGLDKLEALNSLNVDGCKSIEWLPDLSNLKLVRRLYAQYCEKLQGVEGLDKLVALEALNITGCTSIERLPDLSNLKSLERLYAQGFEKLQGLKGLDKLEELVELVIDGCESIGKLPNLSNLKSLGRLYAKDCKKLQGLEGLDKLEGVRELVIDGCKSIERLPDLSNLKSLVRLDAKNCKKLQGLKGLDKLKTLNSINIDGYKSIERLPDLSNLKSLRRLYAQNCEKLQGLEGLDKLEKLEWLVICGCKSIERLPNLSKLKSLGHLYTQNCEKLQGLEGLDKLEKLQWLVIEGCKSIECLPDLSNLKLLRHLNAKNCEKLQGLKGLDQLHELEILNVSGCRSIEKLPSLECMYTGTFEYEGCEKLHLPEELEGFARLAWR